MRLTSLSLFAAAGVLSSFSVALAGPTQWSTVVDQASRQPMLTQKMAKEFFLVAAKVDTDSNRRSLASSITEFDSCLSSLRFGDASRDIPACSDDRTRAQLDDVIVQWNAIKPTLSSVAQGESPDTFDIRDCAAKNTPLFVSCEKAARMYQGLAKGSTPTADSETIIAYRQSAIAQQMAKEYVLIYLGEGSGDAQSSLRDNVRRFETNLNGLCNGDADLGVCSSESSAVNTRLKELQTQWSQYKSTLSAAFESRPSASDVRKCASQCDAIAAVAQNTVALISNSLSGNTAFTQVQDSE